MSIKEVIVPQRPSYSRADGSLFGNIGKVGQVLGTVGTLTGNPMLAGIGAAASTGANLLDTPPTQEANKSIGQSKMVKSGDLAMSRRMKYQQEDPKMALDEGISALESLNLPDEQKQRLLRPMLIAKNARV